MTERSWNFYTGFTTVWKFRNFSTTQISDSNFLHFPHCVILLYFHVKYDSRKFHFHVNPLTHNNLDLIFQQGINVKYVTKFSLTLEPKNVIWIKYIAKILKNPRKKMLQKNIFVPLVTRHLRKATIYKNMSILFILVEKTMNVIFAREVFHKKQA